MFRFSREYGDRSPGREVRAGLGRNRPGRGAQAGGAGEPGGPLRSGRGLCGNRRLAGSPTHPRGQRRTAGDLGRPSRPTLHPGRPGPAVQAAGRQVPVPGWRRPRKDPGTWPPPRDLVGEAGRRHALAPQSASPGARTQRTPGSGSPGPHGVPARSAGGSRLASGAATEQSGGARPLSP